MLYIIKIGGNIIDSPESLRNVLSHISVANKRCIIIHGGGKIATEMSTCLGIPTEMINGRRVTNSETLKVITMVYAGLINKQIVAELASLGLRSVGICGADDQIICAQKRSQHPQDFGFVGDISEIKTSLIELLLSKNIIPVIAPLSIDVQAGQLLNTNADTIASEIAIALANSPSNLQESITLVYCFENNGVLRNIHDPHSTIHEIKVDQAQDLINDEVITKGMIPKITTAAQAVQRGVDKVVITNFTGLREILSGENLTNSTTNYATIITK